MKSVVFSVEGMSCQHCVKAIMNALQDMAGIHGVSVDLEAKSVTADYEEETVSPEAIKDVIDEQGYEVCGWEQVG